MLKHASRLFSPLVVGLAILTGACGRNSAPPPSSPDVWATVDGREIRKEAVEKAYGRTVQPNQTVPEDEALAGKLNVLNQMIIEDIILAKAAELKLEVAEAEVDTAFNNVKKDMPDEAFNKELVARNLTAAEMRDGLRRDLLAQKVIEREVTSQIVISDKDINDAFQANKAEFNLAEDAFHIAQIVVTSTRDAGINNRTGDDATSPQAAAAKAQMLMGRLKSGTGFDEVAMDFSEDPRSAPQGGDVGLVPVSALQQVSPQLRDVVLKAKPGTVHLVGTQEGFIIVAVVARQAAGQRDLSMPEVRDGITATLRGHREQLLRTAYIEAARNQADVVNHLARQIVESKRTPPPTPAPVSAPVPAPATK